MIKILYLHILLADSTVNLNAFCKLIVLDNYKISKKSKMSVLRQIENITGSVGNFVKCMFCKCDHNANKAQGDSPRNNSHILLCSSL